MSNNVHSCGLIAIGNNEASGQGMVETTKSEFASELKFRGTEFERESKKS
jgi:hypothetical protein